MIDPAKSIDENIIRLFFRTDRYLYDETRNLLTQEFADITVVKNIVEQVASGENIGECKFKNEKIDKGIYETLIRSGKLINAKYKVLKYLFFSLSGYTDWFEELVDEDVLLLTLDSLYDMNKENR